jgi:hypothetical protein
MPLISLPFFDAYTIDIDIEVKLAADAGSTPSKQVRLSGNFLHKFHKVNIAMHVFAI